MRQGVVFYGLAALVASAGLIVWAAVHMLSGASETSPPTARNLVGNAALVAMFVLQHSGMPRRAFRDWYRRNFPQATERTTYTLASWIVVTALVGLWTPIPGELWSVNSPTMRVALNTLAVSALCFAGLCFHWMKSGQMLGVVDIRRSLVGLDTLSESFRAPGPYRRVRHPIMSGFLVAAWAAPTMSMDRLVLASCATVYIFLGIALEERDLVRDFPEYRRYRRDVPMLFPWPGRRWSG